MTHRLQHITDLAEIIYLHGIRDVVISPGSRNAPLIQAFYNRFGKGCRSLVDERSAAYFALGLSLSTKKPTVLICTSGTAVLNCAPAIAEAYYQKIPLLILTADRPPEWIGQQDNQAINQSNIYKNYVKASYSLPVEITGKDDLWFSHRIINEAILKSVSENPGPVHINIPLREPLYEKLPAVSKNVGIIKSEIPEKSINKSGQLFSDWENAKSILIVSGQNSPDTELKKSINTIKEDSRVVIIAEPVSNLHEIASISSPEVVLNSKIQYPSNSIPDLVLYFGGQVVSKKIKLFLRGLQNSRFCSVSTDEQIIDTFQNINSVIYANPATVFNHLKVKGKGEKSSFKNFWEEENRKAKQIEESFISKINFSDLQVFQLLSENLPENAIVFAGNSSVIRYLHYFNQKKRKYYSNRGVSGIDGCLSAAAGLATKVAENVYVILGDLAFTYDSNAMWNRNFPQNLKIILINNEGGGIFHLLKGPSETKDFMPFVNAFHPVDLQKLTEAFGLKYNLVENKAELTDILKRTTISNNGASVLEIRTPNNGEPQITKDFFKFLNNQYEADLEND